MLRGCKLDKTPHFRENVDAEKSNVNLSLNPGLNSQKCCLGVTAQRPTLQSSEAFAFDENRPYLMGMNSSFRAAPAPRVDGGAI